MKKFRTRYLALVLSVAAVAAAGCGSSSSSKSAAKSPAASTPATPSTASTSTTGTSPAAFSAQLNALCKQFLAAPDSQTPTYIAKFKALTPSASQKADYDKFLASVDAAISAGHSNSQADLKKAAEQNAAAAKALNAPECTK